MNYNQEFKVDEVFAKLNESSKGRKFVESVEAIIKLNVDPTKGDQMIRGTCILPAGTGKETKVCVFADLEFHD
jgi:large subunit ribosomal protein L1